jgi:predicted transcriptional regulator
VGYIFQEIYIQLNMIDKNGKTQDNFDLFFRRKPAMMLIALKKVSRAKYGSILAKEVDCTYSHAVKILQILEELGLVVFEKKGRIKIIKLTKKGQEVADHIESIKEVVD